MEKEREIERSKTETQNSLSLLMNPNLFLQEYSIPSIQATSLFFNSILFQFKIHIFVSCSLYWIPQIFNFFFEKSDLNRSLCVCVCMVNGTDSEEFMLLSRVRMGHKREFAFVVKAQSKICRSLGWTLATLRYRESEGEKKNLAPHWRFLRPAIAILFWVFQVRSSLSMCFCCFDSVLKLSCDFGISFPCFH